MIFDKNKVFQWGRWNAFEEKRVPNQPNLSMEKNVTLYTKINLHRIET